MDFDFSPAQYELRDEARRFLQRECTSELVREVIDDPSGWSRTLWKQIADLGWMGLPFPEQYGGLGQGFLDLVLLLEELGAALAPIPFLSSVVLAGFAILQNGSEEQRAKWLPDIASGDRVAVAVVPDAEHDVDALHVQAEGDRLTGERSHVLDAPAADLLVVAARSEEGPRWFVVEEGFEVRPQRSYDPTRTLGFVSFDGVAAEPLSGAFFPSMRLAVAGICAEMVGVAQRILDMTVRYTKEREQFGRPIGSFQAIKHKCAEMAVELEASRSATLYAAWAAATEAEDQDIAVAIAKSSCGDWLGHLAGEGVQVHGGIAYTWEHDMHLYLRRMKSLEAFMGDAAYHRERLARLIEL
ncbi:MAG: acyl-CoA dehydrogenase family protein [Actinomycetota bacterium]